MDGRRLQTPRAVLRKFGRRAKGKLGGVFGAYLKRLQELQVVRVELEFGYPGSGCDQRALAGWLFVRAIESYGRLKDEKDVIPVSFNTRNDLSDLLGISERFADCVAQFLYKFL